MCDLWAHSGLCACTQKGSIYVLIGALTVVCLLPLFSGRKQIRQACPGTLPTPSLAVD